MSKWKNRDETCPICGITYETLKTGLDFGTVRMMLWTGDPDYDNWKYKRRGTVLGLWHQIKMSMWNEHVFMCETQLDYALDQGRFDGDAKDLSFEELLEYMPSSVNTDFSVPAPIDGPYEDQVPF